MAADLTSPQGVELLSSPYTLANAAFHRRPQLVSALRSVFICFLFFIIFLTVAVLSCRGRQTIGKHARRRPFSAWHPHVSAVAALGGNAGAVHGHGPTWPSGPSTK